MNTASVEIVDRGRGPQLSTSRITVLDVFYYLHRGYDFEFIHQAMPSLSQEEFDAVVAYVKDNRNELAELDRRAEQIHQRGVEAQHVRGGVFEQSEEHSRTRERIARLERKIDQRNAEQNRARHPG